MVCFEVFCHNFVVGSMRIFFKCGATINMNLMKGDLKFGLYVFFKRENWVYNMFLCLIYIFSNRQHTRRQQGAVFTLAAQLQLAEKEKGGSVG